MLPFSCPFGAPNGSKWRPPVTPSPSALPSSNASRHSFPEALGAYMKAAGLSADTPAMIASLADAHAGSGRTV
jgi:hypothetical protein